MSVNRQTAYLSIYQTQKGVRGFILKRNTTASGITLADHRFDTADPRIEKIKNWWDTEGETILLVKFTMKDKYSCWETDNGLTPPLINR